jgi:hypothetical protein
MISIKSRIMVYVIELRCFSFKDRGVRMPAAANLRSRNAISTLRYSGIMKNGKQHALLRGGRDDLFVQSVVADVVGASMIIEMHARAVVDVDGP